jgi:hypothetical protein
MKQSVTIFGFLMLFVAVAVAQPQNPPAQGTSPTQMMQAQRVYRVFANNESDSAGVAQRNEALYRSGAPNRGILTGLGLAIATSYANVLVQKTVTATSNVMGVAVKYLSSLIHKEKNDREAWRKAVQQQSCFVQNLATANFIDDFYYTGSYSGALDPMNMKFNGFGCKCSMSSAELMGSGGPKRERTTQMPVIKSGFTPEEVPEKEILEFYVLCKIRMDSMGLHHIVNHSKFYVDVDQLVFDTRHTSLPNDSVPGKTLKRFDFKGRKNLTFNLNVKVYSSWVNEAIMLIDNQQIGEFNITARIDSSDIDADGLFVYDPARHQGKVSVTGDCFLVPRSFTGTADAPSWGTGQYRLDMTISETCNMNEEWYQLPSKHQSDVMVVAKPGKPAKVKWDKRKWKPEWKEMQANKGGQKVWNDLWRSISVAYIGNDWVQELVSPLTTAVCNEEKVALTKLLTIDGASGSVPSSATSPMPSGGTSSGGGTQGGGTQGGGMPGGTPPAGGGN